jgi:hypothetical protein
VATQPAYSDISVTDVWSVAPRLQGRLSDSIMIDIVSYVNQQPDGTAFEDTADDPTTRMARLYLAAHLAQMTYQGASGQAGPVISEAAGGLRRAYAHMTSSDASYTLTMYGRTYLDLIRNSVARAWVLL